MNREGTLQVDSQDAIARAVTPYERDANGSWWIGLDRDAFTVARDRELPRMLRSRFGRAVLSTNVVLD